jgi:hypothetical protein
MAGEEATLVDLVNGEAAYRRGAASSRERMRSIDQARVLWHSLDDPDERRQLPLEPDPGWVGWAWFGGEYAPGGVRADAHGGPMSELN